MIITPIDPLYSSQKALEVERVDAKVNRSDMDTPSLTIGQTKNTDSSVGEGALSIANFTPQLAAPSTRTTDELLNMLLRVKTISSNEDIKAAQDDIQITESKQKAKHEEVLEKIQESIDAASKAKKGGVFTKIFGWVASVATAIAGAAMIATGLGAVAGAAMLAFAVDSMIGMATGHSLLGEATKALSKGLQELGMGEQAALITASISVAAATVVATLGAGFASAVGAGGGALAKLFASTYQAQKFQALGGQVRNVSTVTSATAEVGSGASGITTSVYRKESADSRAAQMLFKKELAELQLKMEAETERIREVVETLNDSMTKVLKIMGDDHSTRLKVFRNMI